ncbi:MAG: chemotaxis protein CheW [Sporomusaceae bacterium]|jgi:purine-binding chemotaxis protein CheW|nr:chemotaxis protein CheW [Sporomusaceae bacterium]
MVEQTFSGDETQLVVFKLDKEEYALSILQVQEIKRVTDITRVPNAPDYIKGVLNLRGSIVPVIDLKKRLNLPNQDEQLYTDDTRIIFVRVDEITVGIIVDAVSEVAAIEQHTIESTNDVLGTNENSFLSGVGKSGERLLILLNTEMILGLGADAVKN